MLKDILAIQKIKDNHGLTLIETTIALGILMIGTLASLTLMLASFNYVQQTEHEIVVVNLAREGIEIMRSIRNNEDANDPTDIDLFDGSYDNTSYIVDNNTSNNANNFVLNQRVTAPSARQCAACSLYLKDGQYLHDPSGSETIFKRMITISPGAYNDEKIIISEVAWTVKGKTYSYKLESHLTNWQ
jgi:Tfp pilus assembly protein PilV